MAQIQRKRHFSDTLELLDEQGKVCVSLPVSLNIEAVYTRVQRARKAVAEAEKELRQDTEAAREAYGKAVCELFASVFGDDGTEKILSHYENDHTEMLMDVLPYLLENVFPKLDELSSARIRQAVALRSAVDNYAGKHSKGKTRRRR